MFSFRNSAAAVFGLGALLAAYLPAAAQSPADVAVLAGTCANCHGTDGRSPGPIVPIAGQAESALLNQLKAFKSETPPPGTTIMNRLAKQLTDDQIASLAKYYSQIKPTAPAAAKGKK